MPDRVAARPDARASWSHSLNPVTAYHRSNVSQSALDFAVIGAEEAGIRAVARLLRNSPGIRLSDRDPLAVRRRPATGGCLLGTIAPKYTRGWHGTTTATIASRLALAHPDIKLIALLRDPIDRARSQHQTARGRGRETRSFNEAARELLSADGLAAGRFFPDETNTYVAQSEYGRILAEYRRHFPATALHVELTSEIERAPCEAMRRLRRFLGLPEHQPGGVNISGQHASHSGRPSRTEVEPIADDVRKALAGHFSSDTGLLTAVVGVEAPWSPGDDEQSERRIAVYTAITGGKDTLEPPEPAFECCDYICFTDNPYLRTDGWQMRPVELVETDPRQPALHAMMLPHRYVPEYPASVWVNANLSLGVDPARLVDDPAPATGVIASRRDPSTDALREVRWRELACPSVFKERGSEAPDAVTRRRPHAADLRARSIRREIDSATTVLLSVPKAGRSWLWYFLARYVAARTGGPLDLDLLGTGAAIPPIRFLHEHLDVFENAPAPARLLNRDLLLERRIIVLIRDPRDSLVSYWHQKRVRERRPVPARLELFADCPVYGIERISRSTVLLLDMYDEHPGEKLLVSYEDILSDPGLRLRTILRFALAGQEPDERACLEALAASSFERMREWERRLTPEESRDRYDGRFGAATRAAEDAQFKVRRGRAGAFRTELSPELQRRVSRLPHTRALLERLAARARAGHEQLEVPAPIRSA